MNANASEIAYARTQLDEARRRLESVTERITETRQKQLSAAIDQRTDEIAISGKEIADIPEDSRKFIVLNNGREEEVVDIEGHIQNIIIDCQMSIELAVKSMFKAVEQDFDYSHGIGFDSHNTQGFNSKVPSDFPRGDDIVRAIFLTQLWDKFYQLAKYGAPQLNVGPKSIFDINDGERAINDATFCVELAEDLISYIEEQS